MGSPLNRHAFERLLAENIEWLKQQPRTLEREHVIDLCRHAPDMYYGKRDAEGNIIAVWDTYEHRFTNDPPRTPQ